MEKEPQSQKQLIGMLMEVSKQKQKKYVKMREKKAIIWKMDIETVIRRTRIINLVCFYI